MAKPRFECDVCGADRETVTCNGEGCGLQVCLDCLSQHESRCIARLGDRTQRAVPDGYTYTVLPGGVGIRRTKRGL